jgi:hypothetical protein
VPHSPTIEPTAGITGAMQEGSVLTQLSPLEFVVHLGAVNGAAVGGSSDCRTAHLSDPLSMRTADA